MPPPIDPCGRCKGAIDMHDMHRIVHDFDAFDICAKCNKSFEAWQQGEAVESVSVLTSRGLSPEMGRCRG